MHGLRPGSLEFDHARGRAVPRAAAACWPAARHRHPGTHRRRRPTASRRSPRTRSSPRRTTALNDAKSFRVEGHGASRTATTTEVDLASPARTPRARSRLDGTCDRGRPGRWRDLPEGADGLWQTPECLPAEVQPWRSPRSRASTSRLRPSHEPRPDPDRASCSKPGGPVTKGATTTVDGQSAII